MAQHDPGDLQGQPGLCLPSPAALLALRLVCMAMAKKSMVRKATDPVASQIIIFSVMD